MANLRTSGVFSLGALGGDGATTSGDANWSDVVLLLDGDNNLTERSGSGHSMSWHPSSAYQSGGKFGQALDLTSTHVEGPANNSDFQFGTGDFTIESWVYWSGTPSSADKCLFDSRSSNGDSGLVWFFQGNATNGITQRVYHNGSLEAASTSNPLSPSTWHHVALVRNGNTFTYYTDGQAAGTFTDTRAINQTNSPFHIGHRFDEVSGVRFGGYVDDFRITKGVARYTGTFTPPQAALPQGAAVAGATRPTRRWGGMTGRSLVTGGNVPTTGVLSLPELLQQRYGVPTWDGTGLHFLAVAGGGGGSSSEGPTSQNKWRGGGGGGGAGGYVTSWAGSSSSETSGGGAAVSPSPTITSGTSYLITVGKGGTRGDSSSSSTLLGTNGSDTTMVAGATTIFSATGGGRGGRGYNGGTTVSDNVGADGGSGGGGGANANNVSHSGGAANPSGQGYGGGFGRHYPGVYLSSAGGGGAGAAGGNVNLSTYAGGSGGNGLQSSITGTLTYRAGGGGGSTANDQAHTPGDGGLGGGGDARGSNNSTLFNREDNAEPHTGGGGGGAPFINGTTHTDGGHGGSGVIILRLPAASGYDQSKFAGELTSNTNVTASYGTDNGDLIVTLQVSDATSSDPRGTGDGTVTWTPIF